MVRKYASESLPLWWGFLCDVVVFFAGELFAMCPVDAHPGVAVEPVSDSSRYFILRLLDPSGTLIFCICHNYCVAIATREDTLNKDSLPMYWGHFLQTELTTKKLGPVKLSVIHLLFQVDMHLWVLVLRIVVMLSTSMFRFRITSSALSGWLYWRESTVYTVNPPLKWGHPSNRATLTPNCIGGSPLHCKSTPERRPPL